MISLQKVDTLDRHLFPDWIELQHQISGKITDLLIEIDEGTAKDLSLELEALNHKIDLYNTLVPSVYLKKPRLALSELAKQAYLWI